MSRTVSADIKITEIAVVYICLPLVYRYVNLPVHKFIPLFIVFIIYLVVLLKDKNFDKKRLWLNNFKNWLPIFLRIFIFFILSIAYMLIFNPGSLFIIPRQNPLLILLIIVFYPAWSVYPQELIYRSYFYHRFSSFIRNEKLLILINAVLFSYSHIIFKNWIAIILAFFGSLLFSYTYRKSNSLLVTSVEHALYGNIIFIVGLGEYFYMPLS